jgi:xylulokinase
MTKPAILVIDVGTTVIKTGLFDFTCRPIDRVSCAHNTAGLDLAAVAERLWSIVAESVPALSRRNSDYAISAIGLTGFMHSVIALDKQGSPLPFSVAEDDARQFFDEMVEHFGVAQIYQITGSRLDVTSVPPQIMAWKKLSPREFERIAHILPVKDFLRYRLTGEVATDEIDACGTMLYNLNQRCWDPKLLSHCEIDLETLPPVLHCTERAGAITSRVAKELDLRERIPVAAGGGDDIEILGSGAREPQQVCEHVGSTGSFLLPLTIAQTDPAYRLELYPAVVRGEWVLGGSCSNVTRALDWFLASSVYDCGGVIDWERVRADLGRALTQMTRHRPYFLPYLQGERAPLWNPDLNGAWIGLRNSHTASDLLLSVVEGICFSLRNVLEAYTDLGLRISVVCSSGGLNQLGAQRLRATVYGKTIRLVHDTDPTSFATSALTLCSIGELHDPRDAIAWLEYEPDVEPESAWQNVLNDRFSSFVEFTERLPFDNRRRKPAPRGLTNEDKQARTRC